MTAETTRTVTVLGPHAADATDRALGLRDGDLDWPGEWELEPTDE